ncbi:PLDc N-terminal domain-containing protein [Mycolicibacterium austroafricanum]|uniref:PLDc N-terminal domain-containing protein n=1 Tax=Mycolicibacterium austroafricanum TaxID=39687 RepID=UPI001CA35DD1|nr:PLDc N-terminal domain-containing protein [Mycolicibacterium austroafricanum]QZT62881.1 PLDc N-terminal domain-containing protein [Mycolicibacterium austroafricanum]
MWSTFWNFLWSTVVIFAFVAYLLILFHILSDLLWRDKSTSGVVKAIWVLFLILFPYLTALVYVIVRGRGMSERALAQAQSDRKRADDYIREAAGRSPAQEIADAKALLDAGVVTADEFDRLKAGALGR